MFNPYRFDSITKMSSIVLPIACFSTDSSTVIANPSSRKATFHTSAYDFIASHKVPSMSKISESTFSLSILIIVFQLSII